MTHLKYLWNNHPDHMKDMNAIYTNKNCESKVLFRSPAIRRWRSLLIDDAVIFVCVGALIGIAETKHVLKRAFNKILTNEDELAKILEECGMEVKKF